MIKEQQPVYQSHNLHNQQQNTQQTQTQTYPIQNKTQPNLTVQQIDHTNIIDNHNFKLQQWRIQQSNVHNSDHAFDSYIELLRNNGAYISSKLHCGVFLLKNGLPYSGLYCSQDVNPSAKQSSEQGKQQLLVAMPVQLLLTSYKAQHQSPALLRELFHKEYQFYHDSPIWQNRILITYILYMLHTHKNVQQKQQQQQHIFTVMASQFSKHTDILSFWPKQQLNKFQDSSILKSAQLQLQIFNKQWQQFTKIQQNNKFLQQIPTFTYENYKWIYIHTISRCFGSYLGCTYFVPFCQFFNHHCVQVSYCCVGRSQYEGKLGKLQEISSNQKWKQQQHFKQKQNDKQQIDINQKQQSNHKNQDNQCQSQISQISEQSADSQDYISPGDYSYDQIQTYKINWFTKISYNLNQKQTKQIHSLHKKVQNYIDNQFQWKSNGIELMYIGEILEKGNLIVNQYLAERKKYGQAKEELEVLMYHAGVFRKNYREYYRKMGCKSSRDNKIVIASTQNQQIQQKLDKSKMAQHCTPLTSIPLTSTQTQTRTQSTPKSSPPPSQYTHFAMLCHSTQFYPKNTQVYFEYNRLSNRTLLLRYGFCLQNNKYQHVWIHKKIVKQLGQYPDLCQKMREKGVGVVFKIKLKPYVLNSQFIVFRKIQKWKIYGKVGYDSIRDFQKIFGITDVEAQCQFIDQLVQIYQQQLKNYIQPNAKSLTDPSLTYHQYFTQIYHNQKQKILQTQIFLFKKSQNILRRVQKQDIKMKGNSNLMKIVKKIALEQTKNQKWMVKMIWGYISGLGFAMMQ